MRPDSDSVIDIINACNSVTIFILDFSDLQFYADEKTQSYDGIEIKQVWFTAKKEIPDLKKYLEIIE
jgi:uncharacterized protein with HEPN domain